MKNIQGLELQVDGVRRTFAQWTQDFVDSYYPKIGVDTYRVPALHFNRQAAAAADCRNDGQRCGLLTPPMPCYASGDLAHTQVLESLEHLSHQLKHLNQAPLFIISSVTYDNYLAKLQQTCPKKKHKKRNSADAAIAQTAAAPQAQFMSDNFAEFPAENGDGLGKGGDAEKSVQGKRLLPPRPADKGGQRGEIDVLLLHERCGVVLIEVKSTGFPNWAPTEAELQAAIARTVQKAVTQLDSACDVMDYVMPDLTLTPLTLVVAFPFVTREQVQQAVKGQSLDLRLRFLCKEDLPSALSHDSSSSLYTSSSSSSATADERHGAVPDDSPVSSLMTWWRNNVDVAEVEGIGLDSMRIVVGRICGLMSVVSVWTSTQPRVEVRTEAQAIGEAGRRVADIILLPSQASLLDQRDLLRVWLMGPMGSGKTLMLQLKGRQWVREGRRVVVVNVRVIARGRPIGHALEKGIRQGLEGQPGAGSVSRVDVALDLYSAEALHRELADAGSMDDVCFVVDEVLSGMSVIAEHLAARYPRSPVWCAASYLAPVPATFKIRRLGAVLRNPPSIQLMLRELDLNPRHKDAYTTRSAARGLPCDGPPVIFIQHAKHTAGVRPQDCLQCAHELADIFETKLGLRLSPPTAGAAAASSESVSDPTKPVGDLQESASTPKSHRRSGKTINAPSLSFRDILILSAIPHSAFSHITGYHWEVSIQDALLCTAYFVKSRFTMGLRQRGVPVRTVIDNTIKEIVFPPKDEVIITDLMGAHSLERKVVVFLRGGSPPSRQEVSQLLSHYKTVHTASQTGHHASEASIQQQDEGLEQGAELAMSKEILLLVSITYEFRDMIYPQLPMSMTPTPENAKVIIQTLLGNMMVSRTQSFCVKGTESQGKIYKEEDPEISPVLATKLLLHREEEDLQGSIPLPVGGGSPTLPITKLRVGSEIRGHLLSLTTTKEAPEIPCGNQQETSDDTRVEADSVFLVPGCQGHGLGREVEVRQLQQVLGTLSEDDKDWEFLAASRCLSQYISILP